MSAEISRDVIKEHWLGLRDEFRQQWDKFSDEEINTMAGTYDELELALQQKYGYSKEQIEKELEHFIKHCGKKKCD